MRVHELFESQAMAAPESIALAIGNLEMSYQELNAYANRIANGLIANGVQQGDFVGLCMDRSPALIASILGVLKAGAAYVPLDPEYPVDRLTYMIQDSGVSILLVDGASQACLTSNEAVASLSVCLPDEAFANCEESNPNIAISDSSLIYMIYTSGSTGKPKGSLVYHRGFSNLIRWYIDSFKMNAQTRVLHMTSSAFDLTQKNVFAPLIAGGTLCLLDQRFYDPSVIVDHIEKHRISLVNCTPSAFSRLLSYGNDTLYQQLESLRHVVLGGEPIIMSRLLDWLKNPLCQAQIINSYGPTECTDVVCAYRVDNPDEFIDSNVPIGEALPGFELRIVDENHHRLPDGESGQIAIVGVGVGAGYHNKPELTEQVFVADSEQENSRMYLTGDAGKVMPDGQIDYHGRIDNQVKIRGFRIELGEIERNLESIEGISEAACSTYKDVSGDSKLSAFLVYNNPDTAPSNAEVRRFLQQTLPDFMMPTAWVALDKLPLTPNGKLDRKKLPAPVARRPTLNVDLLPATTDVQQYLAAIWLELLGIDDVGVLDRFFELGGSSLNAVDFVARVSAELGERVAIASFFDTPTIQGFEATLWADHVDAMTRKFPNSVAPVTEIDDAKVLDAEQLSSRSQGVEDIAIIGMAGRFPGADNIEALWENLLSGEESVRFASDEELREAGVSEDDIADPDYIRAYFSMDDVEFFDADFFGYQPREVVSMDPQHRLFLELAWSCLDNAGYAKTKQYKGKIGVFGGVARDAYLVNYVAKHEDFKDSLHEFSVNMGNDKNFPASRVSYKLDLKGPAINVQTACSTSGVSLHLACQSLLSGDSDMALVGGCRVLVPTKSGYRYVEGSALSQDGHIYAFDSRGSGMVRGSGGAFVLIKRLSRALEDGDCIRAVIKSTAINNDGSEKIGYTAPSVEGQSRAISEAIAKSGVNPETISYIETHGTATALGDPIEIRALTRAFAQHTALKQFCRVGSVKTNIGHLDAGAAVAGIVKTVFSMEQGILPASINYESANKDIDFNKGPFLVNSVQQPWVANNESPLRAGVSSFGLGGTNFHAILESAPGLIEAATENIALETLGETLVLAVSAKTEASLKANLAAIKAYSTKPCNHPVRIADLAYSLNCFRPEYSCRALIVLPSGVGLEQAISESTIVTPELADWEALLAQFNGCLIDEAISWLAGNSGDWDKHFDGTGTRKVPLPAFQFDRKRYWADLQKQGPKLVIAVSSDAQTLTTNLFEWQQFLSQGGDFSFNAALNAAALMEGAETRAACVADNPAALQAALKMTAPVSALSKPSVVMMFPGGGAQYVDMGKGLYERFALVRSILDLGFSFYYLRTGVDLKSVWFASESSKAWASEEMLRPSMQLPALCMIEYALARLWQSWGVEPAALVGHSAGENVAACVAGVMTFEECLALMILRGQLFERVENSGMLSISLSSEEVTEYLGENLDLATINAPGQSTVAGHHQDLHALKNALDEKGIDSQVVPINIAAHSRLLDPILSAFSDFAATIDLKPPKIPFVTNLTGDWISPELATDPEYFSRHLRNTVRFSDNISALVKLDNPLFLECGPGRILSSLVGMQSDDDAVVIVPSLRHARETALDIDFTLRAIASVWGAGASVNLDQLSAELPGAVCVLPKQVPGSGIQVVAEEAPVASGKTYENRIDYLVATVMAVLQELSGIPADSLDKDASFLELGFDSLFLTQANLRFKKAFGVKLSLRTLLRDAPTINELSTYIDGLLADSALADEMSGKISSAAHVSNQSVAVVDSTVVAAKGGGKISGDQVVAGPFRSLEVKITSELDEPQLEYLEDFKQRYIAKTAKSQAFNEEHREYYADPRTVMGFKQAWKDLTYTLVGERSKGSRVIDIDGNEYVDCMSGFGAIFFGHNPDFVHEAVTAQLEQTLDYGPQSKLAGPTAKMICELTGMERASFCNTGSEAVLAAIRISRTVSGNDLIVTFAGDYHGIFDEVLVKSQVVGNTRRNMPVAPGIPETSSQHVLVLEYGDPASIDIVRERAHEIAAVLIEPVQSRRPELQPKAFLQELRVATAEADIPIIFDEMITGFRLHPKGAQGWFDVDVDIACYGKVIGGGFPVGIIAGKRKYLDALDGGDWQFGDDSFPEVGVTYFAGTFIRHPIAIAAVNAVAKHLLEKGPGLQEETNRRAALFSERVNREYRKRGIPILINYFGSVYFPRFYGNPEFEGLYAHHLRYFGAHHIWGGRPGFLTTVHSDADLDYLVRAFVAAGEAMQTGSFLPAYNEVLTQYPWTDQQEELWLAYKVSEEAALAYNEQVVFAIGIDFHQEALELAIDTVVNRHESLKCVVARDQSGLLVKSYVAPVIKWIDLSGESDSESGVQSLLKESIDTLFDLHEGPLIRVSVIRRGAADSILAVCASHLVIDGWSLEKIMEEVCGYYTSIVQGRYYDAHELPTLNDYFSELKSKAEQGDFETAKEFWLSRYEQLPPVMELPRDFARPSLKTYKGERFEYRIDGPIIEALRQRASDHNSTLFVVLLSAFYLLLNRLSGEDDVVVGIPAAGQPHTGLTRLSAHMVSFLPLRILSEKNELFGDFLQKVNDEFIEAKDHQDIGYGQLLKLLEIPRDPSRLPLLATCFNMDMPYNEICFDGIKAEFQFTPRGHVKYDLYFNVTDMGDHFALEIDYNSDLFSRDSVDQWVALYDNILQAVSDDKGSSIQALSGKVSEQQAGLLRQWNDTARDYPLDEITMDRMVEQTAGKYPLQLAVSFEGRSLNYQELNRKVSQLAQLLVENSVGFEQPVALMMHRSEKLPVAMLAVMKSGGAYLPLDSEHPEDRLSYILEESGTVLVLVDKALEDRLPEGTKALVIEDIWPKLDEFGKGLVATKARPESLAYMIYTSGSTGKPKGVMVEHRSICNRLLWMQDDFCLGKEDKTLQKTPYTFDVSVWEFFMPLTTGGTLVMALPDGHKDPDYLIRTINDNQITLAHFVPSMLTLFLGDSGSASCKSLDRVVCSGEALSKEHEQLFFNRLPSTELHNFYGPTEAAVEVSTWHCRPDDPYSFVPIGRTVPNTQLHILDENFAPVPIGTSGELFIAGVQVARGYVNRENLTAERFVDDPFSDTPRAKMYRTGDLVRFHDDGVIEYLGRNDFQVKIRGLRIELGEIENVLEAQAGVAQAVVAAKQADNDTFLVAYIMYETKGLTREQLRSGLSSALPEYMVPQHFVFVEEMPLTSSGKVDRKALLKLDIETVSREEDAGELPSTEDQKYLAEVWQRFIDIDEIYLDDNFFDIGGHSLLAAKASAEIMNQRKIDVPLKAFITSNLEQIAAQYFSDNKSDLIEANDALIEMAVVSAEENKKGWFSRVFKK